MKDINVGYGTGDGVGAVRSTRFRSDRHVCVLRCRKRRGPVRHPCQGRHRSRWRGPDVGRSVHAGRRENGETEFHAVVVLALGAILGATPGITESQPPTEGPAVGGSPAWFLQGSFPDPTGRTVVGPGGHVTIASRSDEGGRGVAAGAAIPASPPPVAGDTPGCRRSPLCGNRLGRTRQSLQRVQWKQTMGYTFSYPYELPAGLRRRSRGGPGFQGKSLGLPARGRRKTAAVQVRPEPQADPAGRPET